MSGWRLASDRVEESSRRERSPGWCESRVADSGDVVLLPFEGQLAAPGLAQGVVDSSLEPKVGYTTRMLVYLHC